MNFEEMANIKYIIKSACISNNDKDRLGLNLEQEAIAVREIKNIIIGHLEGASYFMIPNKHVFKP